MSRLAKQAALRLLQDADESDDSNESDNFLDDEHNDATGIHDIVWNSSNEDSSASESNEENSEIMETNEDHILYGKDGTEWHVIDENTSVPGRAMNANILRPAPGLTSYAHQRIRDEPVLDSFLIYLSNGKFFFTKNFI